MATWSTSSTEAPDTRDIRGTVELALSTGQQFAEARTAEPVHYALVPNGSALQSLEVFQFPDGRPAQRIRQAVQLDDSASLILYTNDFKNEATRVFAHRRTSTILSVLDYHTPEDPEFLQHRALLLLETDPRWKAWSEKDGQRFSQMAFAEFIEENAGDVVRPSAAAMLEVARDLHAKNSVTFGSRVNLSNGQIQMEYTEALKAGVGAGNLEVPASFDIAVPVYRGEQSSLLTIRLRYRISSGAVEFFYKMNRKEDILHEAFSAAAITVSAGIALPVFMGSV